MKLPAILLLAGTLATSAAPPVRERVSAGEFSQRQAAATNPISQLENPADRGIEAARPVTGSIIDESEILWDGTHWTIIPKSAVLHIPQALASRVTTRPAGTLLTWGDFLVRNSGWITTSEVSFEQASGRQPLPPERLAFWQTHDRLVVAVHQGGPISVRVTAANESNTR